MVYGVHFICMVILFLKAATLFNLHSEFLSLLQLRVLDVQNFGSSYVRNV